MAAISANLVSAAVYDTPAHASVDAEASSPFGKRRALVGVDELP